MAYFEGLDVTVGSSRSFQLGAGLSPGDSWSMSFCSQAEAPRLQDLSAPWLVAAVPALPLLGTDQRLPQLYTEHVSKPTFVLMNSMGILSLNGAAAPLDSFP